MDTHHDQRRYPNGASFLRRYAPQRNDISNNSAEKRAVQTNRKLSMLVGVSYGIFMFGMISADQAGKWTFGWISLIGVCHGSVWVQFSWVWIIEWVKRMGVTALLVSSLRKLTEAVKSFSKLHVLQSNHNDDLERHASNSCSSSSSM